MADQLSDILSRRLPAEPPEVKVIKDYIKEHFDSLVSVSIGKSQIVITVPGASLAGALRMSLFELQSHLATDKKLVIRIG